MPEDRQQKVVATVRGWRDQLINLDRRNRVLFYRATQASSLLVRERSASDLLQGLHTDEGWGFYLPPEATDGWDEEDDGPWRPRFAQPPLRDELITHRSRGIEVKRALRNLHRKSNQEFMDKGLWVLYAGLGILEWTDPERDEDVRTPIVLSPVRLEHDRALDEYRMVATQEDTVLNPALYVKMESELEVELPRREDANSIEDLVGFLQQVRAVAADRGWRVSDEAVIDVFSFHKEVMHRDLLENEAAIAAHDLIGSLAAGASDKVAGISLRSESEVDDWHPPESSPSILDADASQRRCIAAAREGASFVMDGPPGTGKSQTIANLIAECLFEGRTVLFVSEKMAALDVVKARLDDAHLGEFLLELHSHKATRREVSHTLYESLTRKPKPGNGFNESKRKQLASARLNLSAYASAVNEPRAGLDMSLHEAMGLALKVRDAPFVGAPTKRLTATLSADSYGRLLNEAEKLSRAWGPIDRDDFLWRDVREEFWSVSGAGEAEARLRSASEALELLRAEAGHVNEFLGLWIDSSPDDAERLVALVGHLERADGVPVRWLTLVDRSPQHSLLLRFVPLAEAYRNAQDALSRVEGWAEIEPGIGAVVRKVLTTFEALNPPLAIDALAAEDLSRLHKGVVSLSGTFDRLTGALGVVSTHFGIDPFWPDAARAAEILELTRLADRQHLPESTWIDPSRLRAVEEAVQVLEPIVKRFRDKEDQLREVFRPSVLDLDLSALELRLRTVHKGLRRLGTAYREDKALLAEHVVSGKTTKATWAALPDAVEWKEVDSVLSVVENDHRKILGDHYYSRQVSDFSRIVSAMEGAKKALELAGNELRRADSLRRQLGRGAEPPEALRSAIETLDQELTQLGVIVERYPILKPVAQLALIQSQEWCAGAEVALTALVGAEVAFSARMRETPSLQAITAMAAARTSIADADREFAAVESAVLEHLDGTVTGMGSDWESATTRLATAESIIEEVGEPLSIEDAARLLAIDTPSVAGLRDRQQSWAVASATVLELFEDRNAPQIEDQISASFIDGLEFLSALSASTTDIDEWKAHITAREALRTEGLTAAIRELEKKEVSGSDVPRAIQRTLLEAWIDSQIETDKRLSPLRAKDRDALLTKFRTLDREMLRGNRDAIIGRLNANAPQTLAGATSTIQKEAQKKRRHMPVRKLLEETRPVVLALKPCFMMSPMSVSQFLTPEFKFDLVVFDEASQVRPSDAANAIYRGAQLIVAGDQRQLPPTSFFERTLSDDDDNYEEDQVDDFESVLDLAKAGGLPSLPLRWHYRSQHEHLITYSNYRFYDGGLVTFPGAVETAPDLGVSYLKVDGQYARGAGRDNRVEAAKVVERVIYHSREHPDLTIGVVAFSEAQASTIELMLDQRRHEVHNAEKHFSDDRLVNLFVKNLENVQGDERDIMIFSVGYGPDEYGKTTMNFGPLNRKGGGRRLNVAITRARRRVEVITSLAPEDFHSPLTEGPRHLQRYLLFARDGIASLALDVTSSGHDAESPFEEDVILGLRSIGWDVVPQVGTAGYRVDIGVLHSNQTNTFLLGVECDGAMYHSSRVARDRDRLRQEVLERLGWEIHRIWGPAWYRDRDGELDRLHKVLADLEAGTKRGILAGSLPESDPVELEEVDLSAPPAWTTPYEVARPSRHDQYDLIDPVNKKRLQQTIVEVVSVEGPIMADVLLRRVREAWGIARSGRRIQEAFDDALQGLAGQKRVKQKERAVWQADKQLSAVRRPGVSPHGDRRVSEVPAVELRLAVRRLVEDAKGISRDDLSRHVAKLFGWSRRGSDIDRDLERAIDYGLDAGYLRRENGYLEPASS